MQLNEPPFVLYTNVDPALRQAVEQLPVGDWI